MPFTNARAAYTSTLRVEWQASGTKWAESFGVPENQWTFLSGYEHKHRRKKISCNGQIHRGQIYKKIEVSSPGSAGIHMCDLRQAAIFGFTLPAWKTQRNTFLFTGRMNACNALGIMQWELCKQPEQSLRLWYNFPAILKSARRSTMKGHQGNEVRWDNLRISQGIWRRLFIETCKIALCWSWWSYEESYAATAYLYFWTVCKMLLTRTVSLWFCSSSLIISHGHRLIQGFCRS